MRRAWAFRIVLVNLLVCILLGAAFIDSVSKEADYPRGLLPVPAIWIWAIYTPIQAISHLNGHMIPVGLPLLLPGVWLLAILVLFELSFRRDSKTLFAIANVVVGLPTLAASLWLGHNYQSLLY